MSGGNVLVGALQGGGGVADACAAYRDVTICGVMMNEGSV